MDAKLQALAEKAFISQVKAIRSAPPNSRLARANKHLARIEANFKDSTWFAGGTLELGGALVHYWMSCTLALTDFSTGVKAVEFSASGWGFSLAALTSEVAGVFAVDPATIGGECQFVLVAGAIEEGVVSLSLYNDNGTFYGTFAGPAEGISISGFTGTGELIVSG